MKPRRRTTKQPSVAVRARAVLARGRRPSVSILLVEDEPLLVSLYASVLTKLTEATILTATEEQEALRIIETALPRVVLLDLMIPTNAARRDDAGFHEPVGFHVLRRVKANPKTRMVHVIILSNLDADEHQRRARELGAEEYLVKALLQPHELAGRIAKYLES